MPMLPDEQNPLGEHVSITIGCHSMHVDIPAEQALTDTTLFERVFDLVLNQPDIYGVELRVRLPSS